MAINTHGLKITGLEEASKDMTTWDGGSGYTNEVMYDRVTGNVWTHPIDRNGWTQSRDPYVICVCRNRCHMSAQAIADAIADAHDQAIQYLADAQAQGMDDYTIGLLQADADRWRRTPTC